MSRNKFKICAYHNKCQNGGDGCYSLNPENCVRFLPLDGTNLIKIDGVIETPPNIDADVFSQLFNNWIDSLGYSFTISMTDYSDPNKYKIDSADFTTTTTISSTSISYDNISSKTSNDSSNIINAAHEIITNIEKPKYNYDGEHKTYKQIPKKYMYRGSYENGGHRTCSEVGKLLHNTSLDELRCPNCGEYRLVQHFDEYLMGIGNYYISCDSCSWRSHAHLDNSDCGDNIGEFKNWLEAFYLLGCPKNRIDEDVSLDFYPTDEWKQKIIQYYENNNNYSGGE